MISTDLNIALLPVNVEQADVAGNLVQAENMLAGLPGNTDVAVLPELFSTGFISGEAAAREIAEPLSGATMTRVREWAARYNLAVAGSMLCISGGKIYNCGFFVEPSGEAAYYRKRHLFCGSQEAKLLTPGVERAPVVRFRGWNISMIICYDLRFPVWCRNTPQRYDLLLVPANWPQAREYAWRHLLIARAIENQAYVAGANRAGHDGFGSYDDLSFVFDPMGKRIDNSAERFTFNGGTPVLATLSKTLLDDTRKKLPVAADAEEFRIV